ncbi:MAG TPA: hypothetical protein DCY88_05760 [Cyanobacteria bacterium UBA11372]|nr:hypothetical protein [Cyanobacteria bacterium UBA11372]
MDIAKLTKKLAALAKKLAAVIKLNCRNLIRKTAFQITQLEGKIEAASSAAKAEKLAPTQQKYTWEEKAGYAICLNLQNGNKYKVSWDACSCRDWLLRRRHTGENCKHQDMYEALTAAKKTVEIDKNDCPLGTYLRRTDDWMCVEYEVWCYQEKYNPPTGLQVEPECIGRIVQGNNEILASTIHSMPRSFSATENAINYLIRYNGIDPKKMAEAYLKKHLAKPISVENFATV